MDQVLSHMVFKPIKVSQCNIYALMHTLTNFHCTDNFHLVSTGSGTAKYIQLLTDSSVKVSLANVTEQLLPSSSGVLAPELSNAGSSINSGTSELNTGADCIVDAETNSTENQWYIEDLEGSINTGVRLYLLSGDGEKWYLRTPLEGGTVDLVCEDYVTNIANVRNHTKQCIKNVKEYIMLLSCFLQLEDPEAFFDEQELKFDLVAVEFIHY